MNNNPTTKWLLTNVAIFNLNMVSYIAPFNRVHNGVDSYDISVCINREKYTIYKTGNATERDKIYNALCNTIGSSSFTQIIDFNLDVIQPTIHPVSGIGCWQGG